MLQVVIDFLLILGNFVCVAETFSIYDCTKTKQRKVTLSLIAAVAQVAYCSFDNLI